MIHKLNTIFILEENNVGRADLKWQSLPILEIKSKILSLIKIVLCSQFVFLSLVLSIDLWKA